MQLIKPCERPLCVLCFQVRLDPADKNLNPCDNTIYTILCGLLKYSVYHGSYNDFTFITS